MKILFFGRLSEAVGRECALNLPDEVVTVADLRRLLAPRAGDGILDPNIRVSVDDLIVADDHPLREDCEVAFFPPLSGG